MMASSRCSPRKKSLPRRVEEMLTGPRGLFLIAGQEKVVTVDLERVLTAPPVEHLTVHTYSFCSRPRNEESPAAMPLQASALILDAWQRWSCPNWRHESPEQSCAHRMAHDPLPAGALSTAASIGCCSVPLPLVPPALAPI
jgi:hypothetical protein